MPNVDFLDAIKALDNIWDEQEKNNRKVKNLRESLLLEADENEDEILAKAAKILASADKDKIQNFENKVKDNRGAVKSDSQAAEADNADKATNADEANEIASKLAATTDYAAFVNLLKADVKSAAFLDLLRTKYNNNDLGQVVDVSLSEGSLAVGKLVPTQDNISLKKSLGDVSDPNGKTWGPLVSSVAGGGKADLAKSFIENKVSVGKIVTFNKKYIIDGHHRWSKVFAINPNASIEVQDISSSDASLTVDDVLKGVQIAIAKKAGDIPGAGVDMPNLLDPSSASAVEQHCKTVLASDYGQKVIESVKDKPGFENLENFTATVVKNAKALANKKNEQSGFNPPSRDVMPQTAEDNTKGVIGDIGKEGIIDVTPSNEANKAE